MLVLSRKLDESIQIGTNVVVTILEVKGNTVRIGIEAPREVSITRPDAKSQEPAPLRKPAPLRNRA